MGRTYLLTFTPMEPYFFGGNRQFSFSGRDSEDDFDPYFIKGNPIPEQSMIFGSLRYRLLEQQGLIKKDFRYNQEEKDNMAKLVGKDSFSLQEEHKDFGKLKSISPIFLINEKKEKLIPMPFNLVEDEKGGYRPMRLCSKGIKTNYGDIHLPDEEEYNAKRGYVSGYFNLASGDYLRTEKVFHTKVVTGIRIPDRTKQDADNADGLFKREVYHLQRGFCFACFVDMEEEIQNGFVRMGQKAALFKLEVQEAKDILESEVRSTLARLTPKGTVWHYALSDQVLSDKSGKLRTDGFAIVEEKQVRQIQTKFNKASVQKSSNEIEQGGIHLKKEFYTLHKAGSIYYGELCTENKIAEHAHIAGYNALIKIEGEKE